jgi:hypothetical protein
LWLPSWKLVFDSHDVRHKDIFRHHSDVVTAVKSVLGTGQVVGTYGTHSNIALHNKFDLKIYYICSSNKFEILLWYMLAVCAAWFVSDVENKDQCWKYNTS